MLADLRLVERTEFLDLLLKAGDRLEVLFTAGARSTPHLLHLAEQVAEPVVEVDEVFLLLRRGVEHRPERVHVGMTAAVPSRTQRRSTYSYSTSGPVNTWME